jgi:hypothetical protein
MRDRVMTWRFAVLVGVGLVDAAVFMIPLVPVARRRFLNHHVDNLSRPRPGPQETPWMQSDTAPSWSFVALRSAVK